MAQTSQLIDVALRCSYEEHNGLARVREDGIWQMGCPDCHPVTERWFHMHGDNVVFRREGCPFVGCEWAGHRADLAAVIDPTEGSND